MATQHRRRRSGRGCSAVLGLAAVGGLVAAALFWLPADEPAPAGAGTVRAAGAPDPGTIEPRGEGPRDAARRERVPTAAGSLPAGVAGSATEGAGLRVIVLDAAGGGVAGVEVVLEAGLVAGESGNDVARSSTGGDGRARLALDREHRERMAQLAALGLEFEFAVRAVVPLPEPPRAVLGRSPTAPAEVELRLPPFGSLGVEVTDGSGAAVDDGGLLYLYWRDAGRDAEWEREGIPRMPSPGGSARFPIVPIGKELRLRATGARAFAAGEVVVQGPGRAGEEVSAAIRLGPRLPVLAGRPVDETGQTFVERQLRIGIAFVAADAAVGAWPDERPPMVWTAIAADGSFRHPVASGLRAGFRRVLLVEQEDRFAAGGGETVRRAVVPLGRELGPGSESDLGEIRVLPVAAVRRLVEGIVVDGEGRPIDGAELSAAHQDRATGRWRRLHATRIHTRADGRFAIDSALEAPPRFTVSADAHGRIGASLEASEGAQDLRLVLLQGGRLAARVAAPPGVPPTMLIGRIGSGEPNQLAGRFGYDDLAPGRHDVTVVIRDTQWEVGRVEGVLVPAGGSADDPRLDGIPVACRAMALVVLDADGRPLADTRLRIEDPDGRGGWLRTGREGRAIAVVPDHAADFRLRLGDRRASVTWRPTEQRVQLR